jgi:hypothetical protein
VLLAAFGGYRMLPVQTSGSAGNAQKPSRQSKTFTITDESTMRFGARAVRRRIIRCKSD